MSYSDELRILAEMGTFTQSDFASAIECTTQWACQIFEQLQRERVIERVRVGKSYLYALTERGKARVAKMKPIDPEERCLLVEIIPEEYTYKCYCDGQLTGFYRNASFEYARCTSCGSLYYRSLQSSEPNVWRDDNIPF